MSGLEFLDTNVLVYAYDASDARKQGIAQELVKRALGGAILISTQVLSEFSATLLHKLSPAAPARDVLAILDALASIRTIATGGDTVRRAVEASEQYGVHFYDGMILAAAELAGCEKIWSEDFNAGQIYLGMKVQNPFL
jgi:predicted nucleic acid-binding protein